MAYTGVLCTAFCICVVNVGEMLSKMCLVILWIVEIVIALGKAIQGPA